MKTTILTSTIAAAMMTSTALAMPMMPLAAETEQDKAGHETVMLADSNQTLWALIRGGRGHDRDDDDRYDDYDDDDDDDDDDDRDDRDDDGDDDGDDD